MNEQETKTVSVGDLLRYSDKVWQAYPNDIKSHQFCLFLGYPTNPNIWDPIPGYSILIKVLVISQNRCCVLDIPYTWVDKL